MSAVTVDAKNFDQVISQSDMPVLIDFFAEWCGPCKIMHPIVDDLAQTMQDKIKVAKINADSDPELLTDYNIQSIPTFVLVVKGKVVATRSGACTKDDLVRWVEAALGK